MKVTIVGIQKLDYTSKRSGKQVTGKTIFYERFPNSRESSVEGLVAGSVFVSDDSVRLVGIQSLTIGNDYDFVYDSDGRYTYLSEIRECA